jgi:UPF0755 protein
LNDNRQPHRLPEAHHGKHRSSATGRALGSLIGWGLIFSILGGLALGWAYLNVTAPGPLQEAKIYDVPQGASRAEIAAALEQNGIISDGRIFSLASIANQLRGRKLKPGEYEFPAGATMRDVLAIIQSGRTITYKVTIPEGWTTEMAIARLMENPVLAGDVTAVPPEGTVMADTYVFSRGMTRDKLVADMKAHQKKLLDELWAKRLADSIVKTPEELVTLASIVEKETGKAEERPLVAAVFLNRLKKGMRLQSDPTIIYGIVGGKGKLGRSITRADIDGKTPYNTYEIDGLPPGPIANPGRAAMEAVLNPANVDYLYFVADGTGGHAFATTLQEHNANVAKWREIESNAGAAITAIEKQGTQSTTPAPPPAEEPAVAGSADATQPQPNQLGDVGLDQQAAIQPSANPPADATANATAPSDVTTATATQPVAQPPAQPSPELLEPASQDQTPSPAAAEPVSEETAIVLNETTLNLKGGTLITIDGKLIPVPELKRPRK